MSIKKDIKAAIKELTAEDVAYGKLIVEIVDGMIYSLKIDKQILYDIPKED